MSDDSVLTERVNPIEDLFEACRSGDLSEFKKIFKSNPNDNLVNGKLLNLIIKEKKYKFLDALLKIETYENVLEKLYVRHIDDKDKEKLDFLLEFLRKSSFYEIGPNFLIDSINRHKYNMASICLNNIVMNKIDDKDLIGSFDDDFLNKTLLHLACEINNFKSIYLLLSKVYENIQYYNDVGVNEIFDKYCIQTDSDGKTPYYYLYEEHKKWLELIIVDIKEYHSAEAVMSRLLTDITRYDGSKKKSLKILKKRSLKKKSRKRKSRK